MKAIPTIFGGQISNHEELIKYVKELEARVFMLEEHLTKEQRLLKHFMIELAERQVREQQLNLRRSHGNKTKSQGT